MRWPGGGVVRVGCGVTGGAVDGAGVLVGATVGVGVLMRIGEKLTLGDALTLALGELDVVGTSCVRTLPRNSSPMMSTVASAPATAARSRST